MISALHNTFYTVAEKNVSENSIKATVTINPSHAIFKGHFPQMPVVPGVCQVQIIKDILEETVNSNLLMSNGDNIKFTGMLLPDKHPLVHLEMNYTKQDDLFIVDAKLYFEEIIFTKFKGKFKQVN